LACPFTAMTIESIAQQLKTSDAIYPPELSEMRAWLAGEYAYINSQLIGVLMKKPEKWKEIRYSGEVKSDTAAERIWQATEDGLQETILRMKLKTIDKLSSAIKSRMEVLMGEARNQF
jgi:hypothetical protein